MDSARFLRRQDHRTRLAGPPIPARWLGWAGRATPQSPGIATLDEERLSPTRVLSWLVLALVLPTELSLYLGPLRLTPYRLVLLPVFVGLLSGILSGRVGRLLVADRCIMAFAAWAVMATAVTQGPASALESGGILVVESLGAYLVGRTFVRSEADMRRFAGLLALVVCVLTVIVLPELITGKHLVHDVFGALTGRRQPTPVEGRFGLWRSYGPFDHPILHGSFCATAFGMAFCLRSGRRMARGLMIALGAFSSLSSACLMALFLQVGLLLYGRVTRALRQRWALLGLALLGAYTAISVLSSRSGLKALLWYLTFDRHTASYRIQIWEHGMANVAANPLFGLGDASWDRPSWMAESVDAFWLQLALTYGAPAPLLLIVASVLLLRGAGRCRVLDEAGRLLRDGWAVTLVALLFVGFTVHYWNNMFVLFFLMLGAGAWMTDPAGRRR